MSKWTSYLEAATKLAQLGGVQLEKFWGKLNKIEVKLHTCDLVTEADKESEKVILGGIEKAYPLHNIVSEESGSCDKGKSPFCWVVDPLDGTTNYTHQYPMVCVSIALLHENSPVVGVVYNPILNELFQAARGEGCTLNGKPVHVSQVSSIDKSLLATGFAYDRRENSDTNYPEFCHLTHLSQGVRRGGSAALDLAYVAAGRFDGYWERGLNPWDIAAGILLIEEAGGKVTSYENGQLDLSTGRLVSSNALIHEALISELQKTRQ